METPLVLSDSYMQKWDPPPPHPCVELRTDGNLHTPSTDAFSFNERWPGTVAKPVHFSQSQKSITAIHVNKFISVAVVDVRAKANRHRLNFFIMYSTYTTSHARLYHNKRTRYYSMN